MPDFWTHIIAGDEITAQISEQNVKKLLKNNYQLFNFGCQGADFFFYNSFWPWEKNKKGTEKGELIHQLSGRKLFAEILSTFKREGVYIEGELSDSEFWQQNLVYLLGFISHYAVDRECHPYIMDNDGEGEKHKLIEASIDLYLTKEKWQQSAAEINPLPYYQLKKEYEENLSYFYQLIFGGVIEAQLEEDLIWDSYLDLRKYHSFFFTESRGKYYLFKFLNLILPQDLSHYSYALTAEKKAWPEENYLEFEKRLKKGVEAAQELIEQTLLYFNSEISLTELLDLYGDLNFVGEKV